MNSPRLVYKFLSYVWNVPHFVRLRIKKIVTPDLRSRRQVVVNRLNFCFTIVVDPKNGLVDKTIYRDNVWEEDITWLFEKQIQAGDTVLDIGANIGYSSLLSASLAGPSGQVYACEPITRLYHQLQKSIELNNFTNITQMHTACGNETATKEINTYEKNIGKSSLLAEEQADGFKESVQIQKIDDIFAHLEKIDFIKIDVEGYELEVLKGAVKTIKRTRPKILFEFNPCRMQILYGSSNGGVQTLELLSDIGYKITSIKGDVVIDIEAFAQRYTDLGGYIELLCEYESKSNNK